MKPILLEYNRTERIKLLIEFTGQTDGMLKKSRINLVCVNCVTLSTFWHCTILHNTGYVHTLRSTSGAYRYLD